MIEAASAAALAAALLGIAVVDLLRRHGRILQRLHELDGGDAAASEGAPLTQER